MVGIYPTERDVAKMKSSHLTRVPPWALPKPRSSEDQNPSDDIERSLRGKAGWMKPRQIKDAKRQMEQARSRRPPGRRM